jgi:hypothetical protein
LIVLGVDPGKVCGAMIWSEGRVLHHGQCASAELEDWMYEAVPLWAPWDLEVVCERYVLGPQSLKAAKDFHYATDVIGVVKSLCRRSQVLCTMQTAGQAKSFSSDEKLRALGWYLPTPGGHANDAARHVLVYLVGKNRISPARLASQE